MVNHGRCFSKNSCPMRGPTGIHLFLCKNCFWCHELLPNNRTIYGPSQALRNDSFSLNPSKLFCNHRLLAQTCPRVICTIHKHSANG